MGRSHLVACLQLAAKGTTVFQYGGPLPMHGIALLHSEPLCMGLASLRAWKASLVGHDRVEICQICQRKSCLHGLGRGALEYVSQ